MKIHNKYAILLSLAILSLFALANNASAMTEDPLCPAGYVCTKIAGPSVSSIKPVSITPIEVSTSDVVEITKCFDAGVNLSLGSTGEDVTSLQGFLSSKGYEVDNSGYFGAKTKAAVVAYQASVGLPSTGYVGPLTRERIKKDCLVVPARLLTVLSPNGGEKWMVGTTQVISWRDNRANNTNTRYSIYLSFDAGVCPPGLNCTLDSVQNRPPVLIAKNVSGSSYSWSIPSSISESSNYKIKVCSETPNSNSSVTNQGVFVMACDTSDSVFSIGNHAEQDVITVLTPNGGENWKSGSMQNISWNDSFTNIKCPEGAYCMQPAPRYYNIKLLQYHIPCTGQICPAYPYVAPYLLAERVSGRTFSWKVGYHLNLGGAPVPDGQYQVQVCVAGSNECDTSNGPFNIYSSVQPPVVSGIDSQNPGAGLQIAKDAKLVVNYLSDKKDDRAGSWNQFAPNGNNDYINRANLYLNSTKTIKSILFSTNYRGLAGFTSEGKVDGITLYPAVVLYNGNQLNTAYDQILGTYVPGNYEFLVYDESTPNDMPYQTFGLTFYFTDGTYVTATTPGTAGVVQPTYTNEQVKCVFNGSSKVEKCHTATESNSSNWFSCSGVGSCVVDVKGQTGTKLSWKTSCNLQNNLVPITTIDGNNEQVNFSCGSTQGQGLVYSVATDKTVYTPEETIKISITATNNSSQSKTLNWNNGCQVAYAVAFYDSSVNQVCSMNLSFVTIAPYSSKTWTLEHSPSRYRIPTGTYKLIGKVLGYGETNTVPITITTTPTSQPSITVISPNGGESYAVGQSVPIRWKVKGLTQNVNTQLDIIDDRTTGWTTRSLFGTAPVLNYAKLISSVGGENTYEYTFVVPENFNSSLPSQYQGIFGGTHYKIDVMALVGGVAGTASQQIVKDSSDSMFTLVAPTTALTATLRANGYKNLTVKAGDYINYTWDSTGGVSASSNYTTNNPSKCGGPSAWIANTLKGNSPVTAQSRYDGCVWTVNYVVRSSTGQTVTDTITVTQTSPVVRTSPTILRWTGPISSTSEASYALVGSTLSYTLNWIATPTETDQLIFVHFVDSSGNTRFLNSVTPPVRTTQWSGNVATPLTVNIPANTPAGTYKVMAGLYSGGNRLPLTAGPGVSVDSQNRYQVGTVIVNLPPTSMRVSCAPSATSVTTGTAVTWNATATGGVAPYHYYWSDVKDVVESSDNGILSRTYSTTGQKYMGIAVIDSANNRTEWAFCSGNVNVTSTGSSASVWNSFKSAVFGR